MRSPSIDTFRTVRRWLAVAGERKFAPKTWLVRAELYHAGGACTQVGPGSPPASLRAGEAIFAP